jgi:quinol monooxygenase YgiN
MSESRPCFVVKMRAKPGRRDDLIEVVTGGLEQLVGDSIEPWVVCAADDDPDAVWIVEFLKDDETRERLDRMPEVQKNHEAVFDLLAEPPERSVLRPVAAKWAAPAPLAGGS